MRLFQVTFDTSTVIVLAINHAQLYAILRDLDDKYVLKAGIIFYQWDKDTIDKCDIKVINQTEAGIVSAVAH